MREVLILSLFALAVTACSRPERSTYPGSSRSYRSYHRHSTYGGATATADYAPTTKKAEAVEEARPSPAPPSSGTSEQEEDRNLTANKDTGAKRPAEPEKPGEAKSDRTTLQKRMIIYHGDVSVGVFDPEKAAKRCITLMGKFNGYMKSRDNNYLVVRIPAAKFFDFIQELEGFGKMTHRRVTSEDITAQFVDLTMRMNNLVAARDRLKAILAKSTKVKDTLAVEKELTRVTGDIERIKGMLRYYSNLVSFATVSVRFYMRHGQHKYSGPAIKIQTPIEWIRYFDIVTLFRN